MLIEQFRVRDRTINLFCFWENHVTMQLLDTGMSKTLLRCFDTDIFLSPCFFAHLYFPADQFAL